MHQANSTTGKEVYHQLQSGSNGLRYRASRDVGSIYTYNYRMIHHDDHHPAVLHGRNTAGHLWGMSLSELSMHESTRLHRSSIIPRTLWKVQFCSVWDATKKKLWACQTMFRRGGSDSQPWWYGTCAKWFGNKLVQYCNANTDVDGTHGIIALKRPIFLYLWS